MVGYTLSRAWKILTEPDQFFSRLKEGLPWPSFRWLAAGIAISLLVGGPLSVLLSVLAGVPIDKMFGFLTGLQPSYYAGAAYAAELIALFVGALLFCTIIVGVFHLIVLLIGGKSTLTKTLQLIAYASTPNFIAMAIPQVLLIDTLLHPLARILAISYSYTVDFIQLVAAAYSLYLTYIACKRIYQLKTMRAILFVGIIVGLTFILAMSGLIVLALFTPVGA